jgi:hypothetical protein
LDLIHRQTFIRQRASGFVVTISGYKSLSHLQANKHKATRNFKTYPNIESSIMAANTGMDGEKYDVMDPVPGQRYVEYSKDGWDGTYFVAFLCTSIQLGIGSLWDA